MRRKPIGGVAPLLTQRPLGQTKVAPRTLIMMKKSSCFYHKMLIPLLRVAAFITTSPSPSLRRGNNYSANCMLGKHNDWLKMSQLFIHARSGMTCSCNHLLLYSLYLHNSFSVVVAYATDIPINSWPPMLRSDYCLCCHKTFMFRIYICNYVTL